MNSTLVFFNFPGLTEQLAVLAYYLFMYAILSIIVTANFPGKCCKRNFLLPMFKENETVILVRAFNFWLFAKFIDMALKRQLSFNSYSMEFMHIFRLSTVNVNISDSFLIFRHQNMTLIAFNFHIVVTNPFEKNKICFLEFSSLMSSLSLLMTCS